jgi:hypothetical protein
MGEAGRRKRTKWVQLIAACALLLMLAPFAQQTDREAWLSKAFQVSAAAAEVPAALVREDVSPRIEEPNVVPNAVRASLSDSASIGLATHD